ncbi:MAG: hypothetical protein A4E19_10885 [Nitrospira sp. SG-bin1]|nr:MAG: hypothetical protein A4E19_10885 [Nitrospira sp. SG-bin1]
MKRLLFHIVYLTGVSLSMVGMSIGCASRVVPVSHFHTEAIDEGHGLLLGAHRLSAEDQRRLSELKWSTDMRWWIEDVTRGKRSLIVRLPLDGSFAVKLPAGSYRVTRIVFDSSRGDWHTELPTAFEIRPQECTSLGTSEFRVEPGFLAGRITRHVLSGHERAVEDRERIVEGERCPTNMAQLESPVTRSVKLGLNEKRFDRVY